MTNGINNYLLKQHIIGGIYLVFATLQLKSIILARGVIFAANKGKGGLSRMSYDVSTKGKGLTKSYYWVRWGEGIKNQLKNNT